MMGFMRMLPEMDTWLNADAESWTSISDHDYAELVRQWRDDYLVLISSEKYSSQGRRAMEIIANRLPADIWLFSGVRLPKLANEGGLGAAGYKAIGLRNIRRELANSLELIVVACDRSWTCVFSHEAGALTWERLFERDIESDA